MPKFKKIFILGLGLLFLSSTSAFADISASATVPARASDFPVAIAQVTPGDNFGPNQTIEYQITYGSDLSFALDSLKIEAQWYDGDSDDESSQSVVDYLVGSATNAYGATSPVIDTLNKKIDWTINSFPANTTNQTVNFKIKTNSSYTKNYKVNFKVSARAYGPGVTTSDKMVITSYKYPTTTKTSLVASIPTPTPIPTVIPNKPPTINLVEIRTISQNSATIFASNSTPSKISIKYGTSQNGLNQNTSSSSFSNQTFLTLNKLDENTKYYFKVSSIDKDGNQALSDIFAFKTASAPPPVIDTNKLSLSTSDSSVSLYNSQDSSSSVSKAEPNSPQPIVAIPESTVFKFRFALNNSENISKVQAFLRNKNVLGISFPSVALADTGITDLVEISPGVWEGSLQTNNLTGNYELYAKITDKKGNLIEQKISSIKVVNKFTVVSSKDNKPIEGTRVLIYIYSPSTKRYFRIPSANISGGNPQFTDSNGKLSLVLPLSKYKAQITNLNYKDQTIFFEIKNNSDYPSVKLESTNINPFTLGRYYFRALNDVFLYNTQLYAQILTGSVRFFNLVAAVILGFLAILTLMAFSKRHHIPLSSLYSYFYYFLDHDGNQKNYVEGVVYDEKKNPIPSANVYLSDSETEEIISRSKTNKHGEFFFHRTVNQKNKYFLLVMCKGYKTTPLIPYESKTHVHLKITLSKEHEGLNLIENIGHVINGLLGTCFEALGILTLIFEVFFVANFGFLRTAPFLTISIFNLLIWTLYVHHHHRYQT